jgi:hypothetical protein
MKLQTVCEHILFAGFFGTDQNGSQPTCGQVIVEDVEEECLEQDENGLRPSYSINCPKCGTELCWPHVWYVVDDDNQTQL